MAENRTKYYFFNDIDSDYDFWNDILESDEAAVEYTKVAAKEISGQLGNQTVKIRCVRAYNDTDVKTSRADVLVAEFSHIVNRV